jgi:plastocyanin
VDNRFGSLAIAALLLMTALQGCGGNGGGEEDGGAEAVDTTAQATSGGGYTVVDVRNGGTISGRVALTGKAPKIADFEIIADQQVCAPAARNNRLVIGPNNGLAYAVVYLEGVREGKPMPSLSPEAVTMDQRGCQYAPHLIAAPVGSKVIFTNSDPAPHNVRVENLATDSVLLNVAQPNQGKRDEMIVRHTGPLSVGCDYHPWMNAYVFGVENPYYAVTDSSGAFTIANIPPGSYSVNMWFNGINAIPRKDTQGRLIRYSFGEPYILSRQVEVGAGKNVDVTFDIAPNQ